MADRIDGYAAAAFALAQAEDEASLVEREFHAIAAAIDTDPELRTALTNPQMDGDRKRSIVNDMVGGRASDVTLNLVGMFLELGRGADLKAIADRFSAQTVASTGKEIAEIRSAIPLDDATVARLTEALRSTTGRDIEVRTVVDPDILGGIVARVGDTVIDGSIRTRLQSMRVAMQNR